jgi:uncharacterized protein (TIGR03437 family)
VITLRLSFLATVFIQTCFSANLAVSTYFKDGFTPTAITSDAQANILIAGSAVIDPASQTLGAAVAKINPTVSEFLYLTYLDSAANDQISAITVDSAGNAYVAGWTTNPNFPVVGGGSLGTPPVASPSGDQAPRSFVTKLSPDGGVLFSVLIGGSAASQAMGVAITPQGQILVSGIAGTGFPSTRAFSAPTSIGYWFLTELDPTASTMIFSATGIGGSSIAFDSAGNIYLAGSSAGADYPTTPGAYQTAFMQGFYCYGLCQIAFNGNLQHITKVDPTASTLIYSTGLNDTTGRAGSTTNTGLAVDAEGDVFVTGTLFEASYPFTVPAPAPNNYYYGYLSKLDPTGSSLLFSVPVGGGGVALDSSGWLYVGGVVSSADPFGLDTPVTPVAPPAIFSWVPRQCWPNNIVAFSEVYVVKLDPATGNALDAQWIDGSAPTAVGITLAAGNVWITGATPAPDTPFTPENLSPKNLGTGFISGAYLAAAEFFTSPAAGAPVIACVVDAANLEHVRAVAANQAISLFGENLGSTGGVTVTFGGTPAQVLYVSSSQINVVVPRNSSPVMEVTVNGATMQRQFPAAASNLNLFANLASNVVVCPEGNPISGAFGFQPVALNADGSRNGCTSPAKFQTAVSFFVDGASLPGGAQPLAQLPELQASAGGCPAQVLRTTLTNGFVYQVDVLLPEFASCALLSDNLITAFGVTFSYNGTPVGPLVVPPPPIVPMSNFTPGQPMPMIVWAQ